MFEIIKAGLMVIAAIFVCALLGAGFRIWFKSNERLMKDLDEWNKRLK